MNKIINELNKAYDYFNKKLFGENLPPAIITVGYNAKKTESSIMGIFYPTIKWRKENDEYITIVITSHAINKGLVVILSTLVHEMVHGYCTVMGIEDVEEKNKKKHNENFKAYAEMAKLEVKKNGKVGWGETYPTVELLTVFDELDIDKDVFNIECDVQYTEIEKKKKPKKKNYKHQCPSCERKAETKDGKPLICGVCKIEMLCLTPEEPVDEE